MELRINRDVLTPQFTLGRLSVDGSSECFTVEDTVRTGPKIPGETAIPAGRYRVIITYSPRFQRPLPILVNVPGFEGVRIHPGNTAKDTEGCILVGLGRTSDGVAESRHAFDPLMQQITEAIDSGEQVWIEITNQA